MGTISDLTSLVTQLVNRIQDRKAASDLGQIQQLIAVLQSEQATLHEDSIELRTQNADLKQKNATLRQMLSQRQRPEVPQDDDPDRIATDMLVLIANSTQELTQDMVIQHLGLGKATGEYHFDQTGKRELVEAIYGRPGVGMFWGTTQEGREYLASRNLLE